MVSTQLKKPRFFLVDCFSPKKIIYFYTKIQPPEEELWRCLDASSSLLLSLPICCLKHTSTGPSVRAVHVQGSCGLLCQALPSAGHQLPHLQNVREPHRWLLSRPLPLSSMAYFVSGSRLPVLHPYSWDSSGPPSDVQGTEGEKVLLFQCAVDQMTLM